MQRSIKTGKIYQPTELRNIPPHQGQHVWLAVVGHLIEDPSTFDDDSTELIKLDAETFVGIDGPFCHYCRCTYSKDINPTCNGPTKKHSHVQ